MKKVKVFLFALACVIMLVRSKAHSQDDSSSDLSVEVRVLSDNAMKEKLNALLIARKKSLKDQPVNWYDTGYGYYGVYSTDNKTFLALYDLKAHYVETLTEANWTREEIPSDLKASYSNSPYRAHLVAGYWHAEKRNEFYLELEDENGALTGVWADANGRFYTVPPETYQRWLSQFTTAASAEGK